MLTVTIRSWLVKHGEPRESADRDFDRDFSMRPHLLALAPQSSVIHPVRPAPLADADGFPPYRH